MASSLQYNSVDTAVGKLSKIQEYLDLGYSTALEIALDIEESNDTGESSPEVENLKKVTLEYVQMEQELKQWLQAAEMTKDAFKEEYRNVQEYVFLGPLLKCTPTPNGLHLISPTSRSSPNGLHLLNAPPPMAYI
jgi:hypothetical protein